VSYTTATARISLAELFSPAVVTARISRAELFATGSASTARVSLAELIGTGAGTTARVSLAELFGTNTTVQAVLNCPQLVGPRQAVTFDMSGSPGAPDSYTLVQTSGPSWGTLSGTGAVRTGTAPAVMPDPTENMEAGLFKTIPCQFTATVVKASVPYVTVVTVQLQPHLVWNGSGQPEFIYQ
jgi:hypothetical protein